MTAIICIASALLACAPQQLDPATATHTATVRGGHARFVQPPDPRGGHAEAILEPTGPVSIWVCIHNKEAAWNDTGDPYWGGLQMDKGFIGAYGADMIALHHGGLADTWTPREQMVVAYRAVVGYHGIPARGYGPWPNTRIGCA